MFQLKYIKYNEEYCENRSNHLYDLELKTNESSYKELKLTTKDLSKDAIINYIYKYPILLQRPIICKYQNNKLIKSVIGRPPETVLSLFN